MPTAKKVLAICVNWNGRDVLGETLQSLQESRYGDLETLVVDCGSSDGSLEEVPPEFRVLALGSNPGFGGGVNAGLLTSLAESGPEPEYFLFLNNDVVFPADTIARLVSFAEKAGPGIFGPKVLRYDRRDQLDAAWGSLNWSHVLSSYQGRSAQDSPRWSEPRSVELILGCFVLASGNVVEQIGLFDERFFMYHEEVDYFYRTLKAGFPVHYCPFAVAYHRGGYSTRKEPLRRVYWVRRNTILFLKKHRPGFFSWCRFTITLGGSLAFNLLTLRWRKLSTICRGVLDGFREVTHA